jgi:hypothetical protein
MPKMRPNAADNVLFFREIRCITSRNWPAYSRLDLKKEVADGNNSVARENHRGPQ